MPQQEPRTKNRSDDEEGRTSTVVSAHSCSDCDCQITTGAMSAFSSSSAAPVIGIFAIQGAVEEHANCVKKCGGDVKEIRMPKDFDGLDGIILPGGESTTMAIVGERWGLFPKLRDWVGANKPIWGTCAGMILLSDHAIKQAEGGQSLVGGLDVHVCRNFFGSQMQSCEVNVSLAPTTEGDHRKSLDGDGNGTKKCPAVFIRAPAILIAGPGVEVLASVVARPHVSAKADVMRVIEEATAIATAGNVKRRISTHRSATDGKSSTEHVGPSGQFGQSDEEVEVFVAVQKDNILATAFHPELTEDLRWHQYFLEIVQRHKTTL